MKFIFLLVLLHIQGGLMLIDEFYFHHKRGLGRWESLGHPLDTLTVIAPIFIVAFFPSTYFFQTAFITLSLFSCLFITKDEWVHSIHCEWKENWLHSILFVLHPVIFIITFLIWTQPLREVGLLKFSQVIDVYLFILFLFLTYQSVYWNVIRGENELLKN